MLPAVAVMVTGVVLDLIPVTKPLELTVATVLSEDVHWTELFIVWPEVPLNRASIWTVFVPVILTDGFDGVRVMLVSATVATDIVVEPVSEPEVAVMVLKPRIGPVPVPSDPLAVATPVVSIVTVAVQPELIQPPVGVDALQATPLKVLVLPSSFTPVAVNC